MAKILMIVIDGAGDRGKITPLSSARKENLNKLAKMGINGIMDTIKPGIRPGSDTAHLALLGYDPFKYYTGRGPIEAAGVGIELKEGDVAFRVNFGTVEGEGSVFNKVVVDRRAGRISDTDELVKAVNENVDLSKFGVEFVFKRGSGHRGAIVFRGDLSDKISDVDPKKIGEKVKRCLPLENNEKARFTAEVVNYFIEKSHEILEKHPLNVKRAKNGNPKANVLLLRGAGKVPHLPKFEDMFGMKLACISGTALIKGVVRIVGGDVLEIRGVTGSKDTNLDAKVEGAINALKEYDFVLLHIKAPDEYGHDGDFEGKKNFIEKVDKALKPILSLDFSEICLVVTADHSTPVKVRDHTSDPVPVTIVYEDVRPDDVEEFSELKAYKGGLHRITGNDLFNILLDLTNRAKKFGA